MGFADNLAKFEWENEIPFADTIVKNTIHAMIGEEKPMVLGLLDYNKKKQKWGLNCVHPESNEIFGTYSFGQVNSSFSITLKRLSDESTNMKITVSARQGGPLNGNLSYLQAECEKFNKALAYYLENQNEINDWNTNFKPQQLEKVQNSGCVILIPLIISGSLLSWLLIWVMINFLVHVESAI